MTSELLPRPTNQVAARHRGPGRGYSDALLDREVAEFMTPGCVVISEAASVADAANAIAAHRVHAVLVVGARNGTPLGWVTHRGLLGWIVATAASPAQPRRSPSRCARSRRTSRCGRPSMPSR